MALVRLKDMYTKPNYPKRGVFTFEDYERKNLTETAKGCYDPGDAVYLTMSRAIRELKNVSEESEPARVAMASMAIMYWAVKGVEYNYGGISSGKMVKEISDYPWMCPGYTNNELASQVTQAREVLEEFEEKDLPQIEKKISENEASKLKEMFYKLLLLIYDYNLGAVLYVTEGNKGSIDHGYSANTVVYDYGNVAFADTKVNHNVSYYDMRQLNGVPLATSFEPELLEGYKAGRTAVLEEVHQYDAKFPTSNTWLYFGIDVRELNEFVKPIYDIELPSCRCDKKRLDVRAMAAGAGAVARNAKNMYKELWGLTAEVYTLGGLLMPKSAKQKMEEQREEARLPFEIGKLKEDDIVMRQQIKLITV